ncbi:probable Inosine triphosphate pyrophosphatase [Hanseniaspora guilliermondii]|uniref:Inosine triphosphate pyrophosphatase n=1 Tax=Hanseniaspora guilliermondii TaxID=56406 RepID=A0A1L0B1K3_9ASCO|nr:probable Inosine triphosphate pyrophosphatase [Hanseniaspora guilliermondii]
MSKASVLFVTGNANKLKEVQRLLSKVTQYEITNQNLDLEEIQESSLEEIARKKILQAIAVLPKGQRVVVEDTALGFDALNGLPGAYIKWFLKKMSLDDIVKILDPFEKKTAEAITTVAYSDENGDIKIFQGITKGKIVKPRGNLDFGWDAIFEPLIEEGNKDVLTYGEMAKDFKNSLSHRGKAFKLFEEYLITQG